MDDKEKEFWEKMPSLYDHFYYDKRILQEVLSIQEIASFFSEEKIDFEKSSIGYSYLLETAITRVIEGVETSNPDSGARESMQWGEIKPSQLINEDDGSKYILQLNSLRRELAKKRLLPLDKKSRNYSEINEDINRIVNQIDEWLAKELGVERIDETPESEIGTVLLDLGAHYAQFNLSSIEPEPDPKVMPPDWGDEYVFYPEGLFAYTLESTAYCLAKPELWAKKEDYFNGYKTTLKYLFKKIGGNTNFDFNVSNWKDLELKVGRETCDQFHNYLQVKMFNETKKRSRRILSKLSGKVTDLNKVFRGRPIVVLTNGEEGEHYVKNQDIFNKCIQGARFLNDSELAEIIELKEPGPFGEITYAIYAGVAGSVWDGSYWQIFYHVARAFENYRSYVKFTIDYLAENKLIDLQSVEVEKDLLEKYINERDKNLARRRFDENRLSYSKGLITEFLCALYLTKQGYRVTEFHRGIKDTDIDLRAENNEKIIVAQAKQSVPNDEQMKKLEEHFTKISNQIKDSRKLVKMLFVQNPGKKYIIDKAFLMTNGIELVSFNELKQSLPISEYKDFVEKISAVYTEFRSPDEEDDLIDEDEDEENSEQFGF